MSESERRYQQLIQTSPAPINLFDENGEIIWGNDEVLTLLGLDTRDELVGRSIFDFIHPEDHSIAESELASVVEEKEATGPTKMELERPDGEIRSIRVATAPGTYEGKNIGQAVVIDVTELNEVKQRLKDEKQFIEEALNTLEDVFYVLSNDETLVRWNDPLLEVTGYETSEIETMDVEKLFIPADRDAVAESMSIAFVEGADTLEATVLTKTGERIPYEFRKRRLVQDGDVVGLVGIGRDITQQRTREQHLKAVDYLLQHHLRNQLNVITGRAELLADAAGDGGQDHTRPISEVSEMMLSMFDHHREVVNFLLTNTERETQDIVSIISELADEFRDTYPETELSVETPETAMVFAVPRIDHAFRELFMNALEHSDVESPTLNVTIEDGSPVTITVEDTGPPIAESEYAYMEDVERLASTKHPSGLGLWWINLAVKYSRGSFEIKHPANRGNTVTIELPTPMDSGTQ